MHLSLDWLLAHDGEPLTTTALTHVYVAVLIGRITSFARPSVCLPVCFVCLTGFQLKNKGRKKLNLRKFISGQE